VRSRGPPRAEVEGDQRVPGGGVAEGHVVEDEARGGEVADVGVGGEERRPGDDVAVGHPVEQLLRVLDAAAAAVGGEQSVEVGPVGEGPNRRGQEMLLAWDTVRNARAGQGGHGRSSW